MNSFKLILKRTVYTLAILIGIVAVVAGIESFFGQPLGIFKGKSPALGFAAGGRLTACSWKPNCANSHAEPSDAKHFVVPMIYNAERAAAMQNLKGIVEAMPGVSLIEFNPQGYQRYEFKSAKLGFVDDVEFYFEPLSPVVQMRSASRLGVRDFGVNRARLEAIRSKFSASVLQTPASSASKPPVVIDFEKAQTAPVAPASPAQK
jgi:uncharacterized protein (DUF1499 family)